MGDLEPLDDRCLPSVTVLVYEPADFHTQEGDYANIRPLKFMEVEDTRGLLGQEIGPEYTEPVLGNYGEIIGTRPAIIEAFKVVESGDYFWDPRQLETPRGSEYNGNYWGGKHDLTVRIEEPANGSTLAQQRADLDRVLAQYSTIAGLELHQVFSGPADIVIGVSEYTGGRQAATQVQPEEDTGVLHIWFSPDMGHGQFENASYYRTMVHEMGHAVGLLHHRWILPSAMSGDQYDWLDELSYADRLDLGELWGFAAA